MVLNLRKRAVCEITGGHEGVRSISKRTSTVGGFFKDSDSVWAGMSASDLMFIPTCGPMGYEAAPHRELELTE